MYQNKYITFPYLKKQCRKAAAQLHVDSTGFQMRTVGPARSRPTEQALFRTPVIPRPEPPRPSVTPRVLDVSGPQVRPDGSPVVHELVRQVLPEPELNIIRANMESFQQLVHNLASSVTDLAQRLAISEERAHADP